MLKDELKPKLCDVFSLDVNQQNECANNGGKAFVHICLCGQSHYIVACRGIFE